MGVFCCVCFLLWNSLSGIADASYSTTVSTTVCICKQKMRMWLWSLEAVLRLTAHINWSNELLVNGQSTACYVLYLRLLLSCPVDISVWNMCTATLCELDFTIQKPSLEQERSSIVFQSVQNIDLQLLAWAPRGKLNNPETEKGKKRLSGGVCLCDTVHRSSVDCSTELKKQLKETKSNTQTKTCTYPGWYTMVWKWKASSIDSTLHTPV